MNTHYPAIKPYKTHCLRVDEPHSLYIEEVGNPTGIPVIILHDGPGAGCDSILRRFFDPLIFRMILFDQRGCGRSTPHAELKHNSTETLLADINAIREKLAVDRVVLFGGGFGALLALLYAQSYPQNVLGLLLFHTFLGRQRDINWIFQYGANQIYPDCWQEFITTLPNEPNTKPLDYYLSCLQGNNELARMSAAKNWALWQAQCASLHPCSTMIEDYSDPHFALSLATLQSHYIKHHYFISDNQILNHVDSIRHLTAYFIHGRYDMIYPLAGVWDLHQCMPASSLSIIREAGHSIRESGIVDAIIGAGKLLSQQGLDAG